MRPYCVADTTGPMLLRRLAGVADHDVLRPPRPRSPRPRPSGPRARACGSARCTTDPSWCTSPAMSRAMTASKSASSRMMLADLPPSSCATRFTVGAAARATSMPARVEPVNDTMSMSGCADSGAPTLTPSPLTRLNTPAGTPAASMISAKRIALSGATSDGLSTIVQPAASAGRDLAGDLVQRPVPRRDHPAHADRLAHDQRGAHRPLELEVGEHGAGGARGGRGRRRPARPAPATAARPSPG